MPARESELAIKLLKKLKNKVEQRTWQQLYDQSSRNPVKKTGLNLEKTNKKTPDGKVLSAIRLDSKARLLVYRNGREMAAYSIHLDHVSAYR